MMPLSEDTLRLLKVAHVMAAILFAGNVIVTGVWAAVMFRQRARLDFRVAAGAIVITDWVFTFGGAAALVTTGVLLAVGRGYPIWDTRWIREAVIGLACSTTIWVSILIPAQRRMLRLDRGEDAALQRVYTRWNLSGWLAAVPLLWSIWAMVYKPA